MTDWKNLLSAQEKIAGTSERRIISSDGSCFIYSLDEGCSRFKVMHRDHLRNGDAILNESQVDAKLAHLGLADSCWM